jgi:glycosyltransferase involved in cell wall biosynthesis
MRDRVLAKGIKAGRVVVIPPWVQDDVISFDAEGRKRFRKAHGLDGKFVVMYSGNHSPCHPLDTVLDAARQLAMERRVHFAFVGGGSELPKVCEFVRRHQLANVLCLPYQPREDLAGSLSAADLHLVIMGNPFVGTIHPSKVYNILQVGCPFLYIGPAQSHLNELRVELGDDAAATRVTHGDVNGVVNAIRSAMNSPHRSKPALKLAMRFSREAQLTRFLDSLLTTSLSRASV